MLLGKFLTGLYIELEEQILVGFGICSCIEREVLRPAKKHERRQSDAAG